MATIDRFLSNHPALNRAGAQTFTRAIWGGVSLEYDAMLAELQKITVNAADVNNLSGDELDEVISRYIGIDRPVGEPDFSRFKILKAFYVRENIPSWATVHSIRRVFKNWFSESLINIRENQIVTDLITDGDFEAFDVETKTVPFGEWTPSGTSIAIDSLETYEGSRVLHGVGTGAVSCTKAVTSGPYILFSAYKGYCPVKVQRDSDSYYWNFASRAWQAASAQLDLANADVEYKIFERPIMADGSYNVTITFGPDGSGRDFRIDMVSFGAKPGYPFIHVLVSTFSQDGEFLNNWPGTSDPLGIGEDYDNATFFGQDFLGGDGGGIPTAYYQTVLDYVKPAGVKALFDFVGRG